MRRDFPSPSFSGDAVVTRGRILTQFGDAEFSLHPVPGGGGDGGGDEYAIPLATSVS
mgnify:CR=1 FL=1